MVKFNDGLVVVDQIRPGFSFRFPRLDAENQYDSWYNGEFSTLMPPRTVNTGYKLFEPGELVRYNVLRIFSRTQGFAIAGRPPLYSSMDEATLQWLRDNMGMMWRRYQAAVDQWSRKRRGVVVAFEGRDGAPPSMASQKTQHYFRGGSEEDEDDMVFHVIARPFLQRREADLLNTTTALPDNMLEVYEYQPSIEHNVHKLFEYSGGTVGELVLEEPGGILAISTFGDGDSWYGDVREIAAQIMIMTTNGMVDLNRYNNAPLGVPVGSYLPRPGVAPEDTSFQKELQNLPEEVRPVLGLPEGTAGADLALSIRSEPAFEARMSQFELLLAAMTLQAGVPPQVLGQDIGRNQSGAAIERMQLNAEAQAEGVQNGILDSLKMMATALGCPTEDWEAFYVTAPYQSFQARVDELLKLLQAKAIDGIKFRQLLGIDDDEMEKRLVQEREREQNALNQSTEDNT